MRLNKIIVRGVIPKGHPLFKAGKYKHVYEYPQPKPNDIK